MKHMYTVNGTWISKKKKRLKGWILHVHFYILNLLPTVYFMTELFFAYAGGSDSWQGFRSKLQIKTTYKICWYRSDPREVGAVYQGTQTRFLLFTDNVNYKLSLILRQ